MKTVNAIEMTTDQKRAIFVKIPILNMDPYSLRELYALINSKPAHKAVYMPEKTKPLEKLIYHPQ